METEYPHVARRLQEAARILNIRRIPQPLRIGIALSHLHKATAEYRSAERRKGAQQAELKLNPACAEYSPERKLRNSERAGLILAAPSPLTRHTWAAE